MFANPVVDFCGVQKFLFPTVEINTQSVLPSARTNLVTWLESFVIALYNYFEEITSITKEALSNY